MQGVTLEEILIFAAGCNSPPALGFTPEPSLEFIPGSKFPVAKISSEFHRRTLMKSSKQTWTLALKIRLDLAWPKYAFVCVVLHTRTKNAAFC